MAKKKLATNYEDPALIRAVVDKTGLTVAYGRTRLGQTIYDIFFSSLSAAEVARRHKLTRESVIRMRRKMREEPNAD